MKNQVKSSISPESSAGGLLTNSFQNLKYWFNQTALFQQKIFRNILLPGLLIVMVISPLHAEINMSLFDFPYKKIAKLISKKAIEKKKDKIAVLNYQSLDVKTTNLGEIISEQIIVELVNNSSLNVVERSQVEKLLKELQFNQTGAIDAAAAKKIGNGLGADVLVIGSFSLISDSQIIIFTKLVDTETFQVLGASQESVTRDMKKSGEIRKITVSGFGKLKDK